MLDQNDKGHEQNQENNKKKSIVSEITQPLIAAIAIGIAFIIDFVPKLNEYVTWWRILIVSVVILLGWLLTKIIVLKNEDIKNVNNVCEKLLEEEDKIDRLVSSAEEIQSVTQSIQSDEQKMLSQLNPCVANLEIASGEIKNLVDETKDSLSTLIINLNMEIKMQEYLLNKQQLATLEGSVGDDYDCERAEKRRIMVTSSEFVLETSDPKFKEAIVQNLRKGVVYKYLIPESTENEPLKFSSMLLSWVHIYAKHILSKEGCEELLELEKDMSISSHWCGEYKGTIRRAKKFWEKYEKSRGAHTELEWENTAFQLFSEVLGLFKEHVLVYKANNGIFAVTMAAYEFKEGWRAIVKLPTESNDDEVYFSFSVYGDRYAKFDDTFIKKFNDFFIREKELSEKTINNIYNKIERDCKNRISEEISK